MMRLNKFQPLLSSLFGYVVIHFARKNSFSLYFHNTIQSDSTPLDSDLDQGAGEEAKARQVEPGGMEELWREGPSFGKPSHSISSSTERELLGSPLCSLSLSALQSCSNCSLSLFNLQSSLFVFFLL